MGVLFFCHITANRVLASQSKIKEIYFTQSLYRETKLPQVEEASYLILSLHLNNLYKKVVESMLCVQKVLGSNPI